jgi:hypothetical protein
MMTTEQIGELARHFKIDEASIMREKDLYNDLARFLPKHYRQVITDLKKNILQKLGA